METVLIPNNTTKVIPVGSKGDRVVNINYRALRGTSVEAGQIQIINKYSSSNIDSSYAGDDCGLTLTTSMSSSTMFLIVTADNTGGRVEFQYTVKPLEV